MTRRRFAKRAFAEITHGRSRTPEYRSWVNMISRCENSKTPAWEHYGGRGISVYEPWREEFSNFYADVGPRPGPGYTLDRIDPNGDYEPNNVRWATRQQQTRNRRDTIKVLVDGEEITFAEAVERRGLKYNTVLYRLRRGKPLSEALR